MLSTRELARLKAWRSCLGCGARMWTDRGHRRCAKCKQRLRQTPVGRPQAAAAGRKLLARLEAEG